MVVLSTSTRNEIKKHPINTEKTTQEDIDKMFKIKYQYVKLPKDFDGRKVWNYKIDENLYKQGNCGSCWAFAVCQMLADRYLILSGGKVNVKLSPTRLLLCDVNGLDIEYAFKQTTNKDRLTAIKKLQNSKKNSESSCYGGTLKFALIYLYLYGACTDSCLPYSYNYLDKFQQLYYKPYSNLPHNTKTQISVGKSNNKTFKDPLSEIDYLNNTYSAYTANAPWLKYDLTNFEDNTNVPLCGDLMGSTADMCTNYNKSALLDLNLQGTPARFYRIGLFYAINEKNINDTVFKIKQDIYKWGPVVTVMNMYPNFYTYDFKKIYKWDKVGEKIGVHAIEIVGWGEENGDKFWQIKNTWGKDWGQDGYFKILQGKNECELEDNVMAGLPDFFTPMLAGGYGIKNNKVENIYNINIEIPKKSDITNTTKLMATDDIVAILRQELDFNFFTPTPVERQIEKVIPQFDYVHNYTGGIDPYTGFSRRSMLIHTGLNFTPPISIEDIDTKSIYAGNQNIIEYYLKKPILIYNYTFYIIIGIFAAVLVILFLYKLKK